MANQTSWLQTPAVQIRLACHGVVGVLLGNGDGTFQTATKYDAGGPNDLSMAVGDLRGIGRSDVVTSNWSSITANNVSVLLNNIPVCTSSPAITLSVSPNLLWPPNGKLVPVTVSGTITNAGTGCTVKAAAYTVTDEYGEIQPSGSITLGPGGVYLHLWRFLRA